LAQGLDPADQDAVQTGLERLAWMIHRRVHGVDFPQDIEHELDILLQDLSQDIPFLGRLAHWDGLMRSYVYNKLHHESEGADNATDEVYAQQWNRTFAAMVVGADNRCVKTVLPFIEQLLELDKWDWMPEAHRGDRVKLLTLFLKDPSLLTHINELAQTHPLHERARHLLHLGCAHDLNLDYVVPIELVNALLTFALQDGLENCWFVAPNREHQANEPHRVLENLQEFLESGTLPFEKNRAGDVVHVVPDPYPEQAMKWVLSSYGQWSDAQVGFVSVAPKLIQVLQRVLPQPAQSYDEWKAQLKDQFNRLQAQAPGGSVCIRDVLEHVLADCLDVPPCLLGNARVLMGDGLSEQPNGKWQVWKEGLEAHARLMDDMLLALEVRDISPLAHVWQSTYSTVVDAQRRKRLWLQIEKALREKLSKPKPLPGMEEHLARTRELFFQGTTLRLDLTDEFPGEVRFRIFAKVPGAPGRGMPIRSSADLVNWLDHYSTLAAQATMQDETSQTRQRLARVKAVLCSDKFQSKLRGKGKPVWLAKVSMGHKDHRGDFGAVPDLDKKPKDGFLKRVFGVHARNDVFVGGRIYRVEAPIGMGQIWGRQAPEQCLRGLIDRVRFLGKKHQPEDLRQHMQAGKSLTYDALFPNLKESHVATVRTQDPGFRSLWASGLSARQAIDRHLKKPMKEQLKAELTPQEASTWVDKVFRQCQLTDGADRQAAVDEVLQRAQDHSKRSSQDPLSLKSLLWSLQDYRRDRSTTVFGDRKAARTELVIAVLNELPGDSPPMAVAEHNNYRSLQKSYGAYVANPFDPNRIVYVEGHYLPVGKDKHRFRAAKLSTSRIY